MPMLMMLCSNFSNSNTSGVTPGPQAIKATRKALEDLQAEHRARVQRIASWAGEASTTLVPLGMSPILVSELPTSISDAHWEWRDGESGTYPPGKGPPKRGGVLSSGVDLFIQWRICGNGRHMQEL
jgi:ABC-type Fe3+-hydroxamate transport system substrate-binding protein